MAMWIDAALMPKTIECWATLDGETAAGVLTGCARR